MGTKRTVKAWSRVIDTECDPLEYCWSQEAGTGMLLQFRRPLSDVISCALEAAVLDEKQAFEKALLKESAMTWAVVAPLTDGEWHRVSESSLLFLRNLSNR